MATTIERNLHFNDTRRIIADPAPEGYDFIGWEGDIKALNDSTSIETIVTMPEADVTVEAKYAIKTPSLRLVWDNIENITGLVSDINSVNEWNDFFQLPDNGNPFTEVQIFKNEVRLIGGSNINIASYTFAYTDYSEFLIKVIDEANCVTSIGNNAFSDYEGTNSICINLNTAIFPAVTEIFDFAFYNCFALYTTDFTSLITGHDFCFYGCSSLPIFVAHSATDFGNHFLEYCSSLITAEAENLINAGDWCFSNTISSTHYNFPALEWAGDSCFRFYYDTELTDINLPIVTHIGTFCFYYCFKATNIYCPLITDIPTGAFGSCRKMSIISCNVIYTIGNNAFENSRVGNLNFDSCTSVGQQAFENCRHLGNIGLPLITNIPISCFQNSTTLSEYEDDSDNELPIVDYGFNLYAPLVENIGIMAFYHSGILEIDLPNCTYIENDSMRDCYLVNNINLPLLVEAGARAFANCWNITHLVLPSLTTLGQSAFYSNFSDAKYAQLTHFEAPLLTYLPAYTFWNGLPMAGGNKLTYLDIRSVTSIGSGATNPDTIPPIDIFDSMWNISGQEITIIIDPVLRTNNAGGLDDHLQQLVDNNTVTLIDA